MNNELRPSTRSSAQLDLIIREFPAACQSAAGNGGPHS
jgi:hypothetical protein